MYFHVNAALRDVDGNAYIDILNMKCWNDCKNEKGL